jgi:asparagine N-glycosylation enzyme membrane subunit Stt3
MHPFSHVFILIFTLIVIGALFWLVNAYIPLNAKSKTILNVVVVIAAVLWVAYALGFMNYRCIEGMRVFHT